MSRPVPSIPLVGMLGLGGPSSIQCLCGFGAMIPTTNKLIPTTNKLIPTTNKDYRLPFFMACRSPR